MSDQDEEYKKQNPVQYWFLWVFVKIYSFFEKKKEQGE